MEMKKLFVSTVNVYTMTSQQILQSDLLDILFEKRNKLYGAYSLRKNYPKELLKAMGVTALLVLCLLFFGSSTKKVATIVDEKPPLVITEVSPIEPKKPEPLKPQQPQTPPVKQVKLSSNIVAVDHVPDPVAKQDDISDALPGNTNVAGPPAVGLQPPQLPPVEGSGTAEAPPVEKKEPPLPSRAPQFPGGTQAWLNFLGKHLRPVQDLEPGEKRSCLIRFSVDEEGAVTNFVVVQSGGSEFDNEVIRVLKKMPKWLPAIQNGKPAAVSFTQPVTFVAQEE